MVVCLRLGPTHPSADEIRREWAERFLTTEVSPEHKELFIDNRSQTSYVVYRTCRCQVRTEPLSESSTSRDRTDLAVQGPAALGGYCVLDISVVSPLSVQNHKISRLLEDRHRVKIAQYLNQFHNQYVNFTEESFTR
jgi:hypothetical protein